MNRRPSDIDVLLQKAIAVRQCAYAPYSKFAVGAAVETSNGRIFAGCNVENASYGLTICAERAAIFCAVAAGETNIRSIAVVADSPEPVAPCGACRQVMAEFGVQQVFLYNTTGMCKAIAMADLLPYAFGSQQMKGATISE